MSILPFFKRNRIHKSPHLKGVCPNHDIIPELKSNFNALMSDALASASAPTYSLKPNQELTETWQQNGEFATGVGLTTRVAHVHPPPKCYGAITKTHTCHKTNSRCFRHPTWVQKPYHGVYVLYCRNENPFRGQGPHLLNWQCSQSTREHLPVQHPSLARTTSAFGPP